MIRPANAASIWIEDGMIYLELPSPEGGRSHTVSIHKNPESWITIETFLSQRHPQSKLGERGDPTQHHINAQMKYGTRSNPTWRDEPRYDESRVRRAKPKFTTEIMDGAKSVLQKMGIIQ